MIKIIDDWYITVETNPVNYIVRCGKDEKDKKGGWRDKPYAFFGTLRKAVKFIRDQIIAKQLSEASSTLPDAIRAISDVDERIEKVLEVIEA